MNLPFPRSYWVDQGSLLAGFYPGDKDPVERDRKLSALLDRGVTRIINLMEPDELDHAGHSFEDYAPRYEELARDRGVTVHTNRHPIVDRSVPTPAGMTRFQVARSFLERYPEQIVGVSIHKELWIPAEELLEMNRNIVGFIEVIAEFH